MTSNQEPVRTRVIGQRERDEIVNCLKIGVVLVEVCGHLAEARDLGLFDSLPARSRLVIETLAPSSLGGKNNHPESAEIWRKMREATLADPESRAVIDTMRYEMVRNAEPSLTSLLKPTGGRMERSIADEVIKLFK